MQTWRWKARLSLAEGDRERKEINGGRKEGGTASDVVVV